MSIFDTVTAPRPKSSVFNLSHDVKLSGNMGTLMPVLFQEVMPGDRFRISGNVFTRFAPLISPLMHRVNVSLHYWFVPYRLVWENFNEWLYHPDSDIEAPYLNYVNSAISKGSLGDYMGLPTSRPITSKVNALPFAAYQMIFDRRYRDETLQDEILWKLSDGDNVSGPLVASLGTLRNRAWAKDYFTSALPFAQRGPAVTIPLFSNPTDAPVFKNVGGSDVQWDDTQIVGGGASVSKARAGTSGTVDPDYLFVDSDSFQAEAATIADLRRSMSLQQWLELAARAGVRPREAQQAFFGVDPGDARIQDPEYITGVFEPVVINDVDNTAGMTGGLPQGNLAGKGTGVATGSIKSYFGREFGCIIGILNVQPIAAYQDGISKSLCDRFDQFKYPFPQFAHIGEQEILNKELYCDNVMIQNEGTFGYTPRYADWKTSFSRVCGEFRDELDFWHMSRKFATRPVLDGNFIAAVEGVDGGIRNDVFAVTDPTEEKLYMHVLNGITVRRNLPYYGNPGLTIL